MKNNESTIFVFIAAIVIGILISLNFNLKKENKYVPLSSKQYQEALNKRNTLYSDITKLKQDNKKIKDKINIYNNDGEKSKKIAEDANREIDINKILEGLTPVEGDGVKLVIKDSSNFDKYMNDFNFTKVLHDHDMMNVVNELKNSGAEAISINNQRVVSNTSIFCSGPFLEINKVNTPGPFYVYVIGDPDLIIESLNETESYIKGLINRGLDVTITRQKNIKMAAYVGTIPSNYLKFYIK